MDVAVKRQRGMLNRPILIAIPIIIGLIVSKSPVFMMANAPTADKPWADQPVALVTTPQFETKKVSSVCWRDNVQQRMTGLTETSLDRYLHDRRDAHGTAAQLDSTWI